LAASFTRGTDDTITLADATLFPSAAHVVRIRNTNNTKWCLVIYTTKAANVLTMGGGAADYAVAKNVTVGDEAYVWPIGSNIEILCAADEIGQIMAPIAGAGAGEIFFEESGVLETDSGLVWVNASKRLDITKTALGTTPSGGLKLINTTVAADGAQQYSPPHIQTGYGWETDTTSSMAVSFRRFVRPVQGAAAPTGWLDFQSSINGGAYSTNFRIGTNGAAYINPTAGAGFTVDGTRPIELLGTGYINWSGAAGGWINVFQFKGNLGTNLCQIGTMGSADAFTRFFVGPAWNNTWLELTSTALVINENSADRDVRVESDGNINGLFFEGSRGNLGLGTATLDGTAEGCLTVALTANPPAAHTDDQAYLYVKDVNAAAGYAGFHMMGENGANSYEQIICGVVIKADTGRTATPNAGMIEINTFDEEILMYTGVEWVQIGVPV